MMLLLTMLLGCADTSGLEARVLLLEESQADLQRQIDHNEARIEALEDHLRIIHGGYADLAEAVQTLEVCE